MLAQTLNFFLNILAVVKFCQHFIVFEKSVILRNSGTLSIFYSGMFKSLVYHEYVDLSTLSGQMSDLCA